MSLEEKEAQTEKKKISRGQRNDPTKARKNRNLPNKFKVDTKAHKITQC